MFIYRINYKTIAPITNRMHSQCSCEHHVTEKECKESKLDYIITLIQDNFISPYKILYLLDPKQADHFKRRNQSSGCCSSNHITISDQNLTKIEKNLKELISYSGLVNELDAFLSFCNQKYNNIIESGKKDNLKITPEVQKFLLDKVMMEAINQLIFTKLSQNIKEQSTSNNKEIGLWATPASWYQKYPQQPLDFLPKQSLGSLLTKGLAICSNYVQNHIGLLREFQILEKDGKFQQSKWLPSLKSKVMNNPERYIEMKTSDDDYLFEQFRELFIKVSSIPFEINAKANLFCTVSPNLHVIYSKEQFQTSKLKGQLKYTVLINVGGSILINLNESQIEVQNSSLVMFDNQKLTFSIKNKKQPIFLILNYIGCAQKK